jgi:putative endonuclease
MMQRSPVHLIRGREAEDLACARLQQAGLTLTTRNYRSAYGEIDLIMQERDTLVFVEVRYRASMDFGSPAETVDARKQGRLRATAEYYLQNTPQASKKPCRFDIVALTGDGEGSDFRWLRNVF